MDGSINGLRITHPQGAFPQQADAQGSTFTDEYDMVRVNKLRILR